MDPEMDVKEGDFTERGRGGDSGVRASREFRVES